MRTVALWQENLVRAFPNSAPTGAFQPLRSLIDNVRLNPVGWMRDFPLIDVIAVCRDV